MGCVVPPLITSRPLRHPSTHPSALAGFTRLERRLPSPEREGGSRASGPRLLSLFPHTDGRTPGPRQVLLPFPSPVGSGLPLKLSGSACSPPLSGFIPQPDSSSNARSGVWSRGCTIRVMLRSAGLASTPGWIRPRHGRTVGAGGTVAGGFRLDYRCLTPHPSLSHPMSLLGTLSGQVQPAHYCTDPPPAYPPERAIGGTRTFTLQVERS